MKYNPNIKEVYIPRKNSLKVIHFNTHNIKSNYFNDEEEIVSGYVVVKVLEKHLLESLGTEIQVYLYEKGNKEIVFADLKRDVKVHQWIEENYPEYLV